MEAANEPNLGSIPNTTVTHILTVLKKIQAVQ